MLEKIMYQIGDLIIYGSYGACRVEAIGTPDISGLDETRIYYTLCPFYQNGKVFTPIDTSVFMRPIITYEKAQQLIDLIPSIRTEYNISNNSKLVEVQYQESMQSHECSDLIKVIKTVYNKRVIAVGQGKKLGQIDERYMKKAEDLLYGELAVALGIPRDDVKSFIEERVDKADNGLAINS